MKYIIQIIIITVICFTVNCISLYPENKEQESSSDLANMLKLLDINYPHLPPKAEDINRPSHIFPTKSDNPEGSWKDSLKNTYLRSDFGSWNNYDESKVGNYSPIDLLKMHNGTKIRNRSQWWSDRRPELFSDVQREVWGTIPQKNTLPKVRFSSYSELIGVGDTAFVQKRIRGNIDISGYPEVKDIPQITATLRLPTNIQHPVPVLIVISSNEIIPYYQQKYCFENGWAICIFDVIDLQPDNQDALPSFLIGLCNKGGLRQPEDWGSLVAWSWGIGKLIDHLENEKDIDVSKIGVFGVSRYGKAALVAAAYEQRIYAAYISCSGALGAKLSRRNYGETIENVVNKKLYHWCAGNLLKWIGNLEEMPVDAHSLMALCAPRKIFITGGTNDSWTDPYGMYLACKEATPVYELLGCKGLITGNEKPVPDRDYIAGNIGFRLHTGGHSDIYDWVSFFNFINKE